ncbi:hypothetical protein ABIA33_003200 [Streptacidiphilus sp. MAP12-16]|uniref:hypothetical protein n=1 Tax=Streptacidiphilus sp. MAP12-16 TaxID=3156300 RepID=UPI0035125843
MDESGRGAIALAVVLRDAHFRLKSLVRAWEQLAAVGSVSDREALGPVWQYSDDPSRVTYFDGHALVLKQGGAVTCELAVDFNAQHVDIAARVTLEQDGEESAELLCTGPLEFPASADELVVEIGRCLDRLEQVDVSGVLCEI